MAFNPSGFLVPTLVVIVLVLLAIIIWLLRQAPPRPSKNGGTPKAPKERLVSKQYAKDQILIGGTPEAIAEAVKMVNAAEATFGFKLAEIVYQTAVSLEDLESSPNQDDAYQTESAKQAQQAQDVPEEPTFVHKPRPASATLGFAFQIRHFRVLASNRQLTMPAVERAINQLGGDQKICASANYGIGWPEEMLEGDPGSGEGFPGSGEGFPGSGEGFPGSGEGFGGQQQERAVKADFYNQWALHDQKPPQKSGINLFKQPFSQAECALTGTAFQQVEMAKRTVAKTGENCRIVVFDSSPYDDFVQKQKDAASPFIQKVVHNELKGTPDARDHGLFVASLAHVVAPDSEIHLYRVLNDSNQGYLEPLIYNICEAINEFAVTNRAAGVPEDNILCGLVLNFSMGIYITEADRREAVAGTKPYAALVPALYCLLKVAHEHGAIIVAAVGNDSAQQSVPKPAHVPALYPFVIGVESGNAQGKRSCFSNKGDVRAPGGDNLAGCTVVPYEALTPDQRKESSVIGFVKEISPVTKYAFWRGTSFAAPMVSGLAALLLEAQKASGKCDSGRVEQIIRGIHTAQSVSPGEAATPLINVLEAVSRLTENS